MHKLLTAADILISYPLFFLSLLVPREKQLWVFIGWHDSPEGEIFADNTKYLFLHTHHNAPAIRAVWLTKDKKLAQTLRSRGYHAYYEHSIQGIWHALRADFTVVDAYLQRKNFRLSGRSKIVQLLHGKGVKKGGYAKKQYRKQDYICGPSQFALDLLPTSFTRESKLCVTGYPRTDIFFRSIPDSNISTDTKTMQVLMTLEKNGVKRILYAPTYRRGFPTLNIADILDLSHLSSWLSEHNAELFITLHPKYRKQSRDLDYKNIHLLGESDIQTLLPHFDVLVADYGSIFTDFLLLNKPIVFFPFDKEQYEKQEGFCVNYDEITPGEKAYTTKELPNMLEKALASDSQKEKRERVRQKYHAYADGKASERILKSISSEEGVVLR